MPNNLLPILAVGGGALCSTLALLMFAVVLTDNEISAETRRFSFALAACHTALAVLLYVLAASWPGLGHVG